MRVTCTYGCGRVIDDAIRSTMCPHNELIGPYATPKTSEAQLQQETLRALMGIDHDLFVAFYAENYIQRGVTAADEIEWFVWLTSNRVVMPKWRAAR